MRHWLLGFAATFALASGLLGPDASYATMGEYAGIAAGSGMIDGRQVSAQAVFEIVGGKLRIKLRHTGTDNYNYYDGLAQTLTDINFNFDTPETGFQFQVTGSSVEVASDSTLYLEQEVGGGTVSGPYLVSSEWALATGTLLPPSTGSTPTLGPFDISITSATFETPESAGEDADADTFTQFATGTIAGAPGLDGPDFGLLNRLTVPTESPFSNHSLIVNRVIITLAASRALDDADLYFIKLPTFSFGSEHVGIPGTYNVVPEPSAILVWSLLGLTWAGSSWVRRRRRGRIHGRTEKALA